MVSVPLTMVEIAERLRVSIERFFLKDLADLAQNLETVQKDLHEPNDITLFTWTYFFSFAVHCKRMD